MVKENKNVIYDQLQERRPPVEMCASSTKCGECHPYIQFVFKRDAAYGNAKELADKASSL